MNDEFQGIQMENYGNMKLLCRHLHGWSEENHEKKCMLWSIINLYSSPNIVRVINSKRRGWAGHVECTEEMDTLKTLVGRHKMMRQFWGPRHRWKYASILQWTLKQ
jgi:hypothetical protein